MTSGYRVVFIGDTEVGKTSIINRFIRKEFADQDATVGATFFSFMASYEGNEIALQIWDTAGQEKFRAIGPIYYRKSLAAVAVFDLTRRETLDSLKSWINEFRNYADDQFVIVVGNKQDLDDSIVFELGETQEWARSMNAECIWSSAKSEIGVQEIVNSLAKHFSAIKLKESGSTQRVVIPQEQCNPPENSCC